jgi:hypothetical protein
VLTIVDKGLLYFCLENPPRFLIVNNKEIGMKLTRKALLSMGSLIMNGSKALECTRNMQNISKAQIVDWGM